MNFLSIETKVLKALGLFGKVSSPLGKLLAWDGLRRQEWVYK